MRQGPPLPNTNYARVRCLSTQVTTLAVGVWDPADWMAMQRRFTSSSSPQNRIKIKSGGTTVVFKVTEGNKSPGS